ncbi:hypothetical protein MKX01_034751 [Papaver californicum]|nr:hypothetical protein MKX01_042320 [Papaver californicum]KAI3965264.1 hypothetical protein MKX01_034751 [Papaver californicum]
MFSSIIKSINQLGHMMWLQRQDNFKKKFGEQNQNDDENNNKVKDKEEKVIFDF